MDSFRDRLAPLPPADLAELQQTRLNLSLALARALARRHRGRVRLARAGGLIVGVEVGFLLRPDRGD